MQNLPQKLPIGIQSFKDLREEGYLYVDKTELIYNYLTGGEFSSRIRYIIESYDEMSRQLDTEKKQAQRRWAAQEKILQKVTTSLYGMSGDLQGIAGKEIIALSAIDGEDRDQEDAYN